MFKIGEFSELVRVSPRMLRHYEKCGLLYPAHIDRMTGYRWYAAAQIPLLLRITSLRAMGFSIEETAAILPRMDDAAYMDRVLADKYLAVQAAIAAEDEKLRLLRRMREHLTQEDQEMAYEVMLKELPAVRALTLRRVMPDYSREGELWAELGAYMAAHGVPCPTSEVCGYSLYHGEARETDVDVEIAVPVEAGGAAEGAAEGAFVYRELAALPLAATLRFAGPYEGYSATIARLAAWMEENGYEMCGPVRGASIRTEADQTLPENFLTEIQVPVRRRAQGG